MKRMDFDVIYNRKGTSCIKHDQIENQFGSDDLLPMWIADMDFSCPPEVFQAISKRMEHPILGYTCCDEELRTTIVNKMKEDYQWEINPEWIVMNYNVIQGINASLQVLTNVGEEVLVQPPVYYPFFSLIKGAGRQVAENPLKHHNNTYVMDYDQLHKKLEISNRFGGNQHQIKAAILCNPHNPVGRAYTKQELLEYGQICLDNNIAIISDEIHCDMIFKGHKHYPIASLSKELEQNTITCMSGGKSYNISGLAVSFSIIPNDTWRNAILKITNSQPSVLSLIGLNAAIHAGKEYYLAEVLEYIEDNYNYAKEFIESRIPSLGITQQEATFLMWIDCVKLGLCREGIKKLVLNDAKIALDYGYVFGTGGECFIRLNIATPKVNLTKALENLEQAINNHLEIQPLSKSIG